jgi:cytosine/adenosine deaminase-related metal-dependent hydrolase
MLKLFANARVMQPDMTFCQADILVQDDIIHDLLEPGKALVKPVDSEVDLQGHLIFPGLVNSHDHLVETCWKGLGETPATNWYEWDKTVRGSEDYKLLQKLSVTDLYIIGMYKNVIAGANGSRPFSG